MMTERIASGRQATIDPPTGPQARPAAATSTAPAAKDTDADPVPAKTGASGGTSPSTPPTAPKQGKATPVLADSLIAAWDTERIDEAQYIETLLPDVRLDFEEVSGNWDGFPDFLKRLKVMQEEAGGDKHVTLVLNVHGNNGTGLKMVSYRREAANGEPEEGPATHADVSIASAAQINVWLQEAGFDPSQVTIISEVCNAGPAYVATVDGFNAAETAAARKQAQRLADKEHVALGKVTFVDPKAAKANLTYHWIGRRSGGNTAGTVFLQAATGLGTTGVSGKVAAAPLVDLNRLGKPGQVRIAVTGDRNPWPDAHFNEMIAALRERAPRMFPPLPVKPTNQ
jgi:hypothetical protein